MSYENWKNKAQGFQTVDVRHIQGSFFEGLKKRAEALEVGEGLHIIQTFEPHPLYAVMEGLGYEHHTGQRGAMGIPLAKSPRDTPSVKAR